MSAAAPNRAVSATVLLLALVVTGGCLAMASAVPVDNGRRLQQLGTSGDLTSKLQALTSALQKLDGQLQKLLQTVVLPSNLLDQLQQVAKKFAIAEAQLNSNVQSLLKNLQLLGQPQAESFLKDLLTQLAAKLDELLKQFQNPQRVVAGCFGDLQASLEAAISDLTRQLKSTTDGLPGQPLALIAALNNLGDAVGQVNPCAPGLENLLGNEQDVLATVGRIVAAIK